MKSEIRKKEIEVEGKVKEMQVKASETQLARPQQREGMVFAPADLINLLSAFGRGGVSTGTFTSPGPGQGGGNGGHSSPQVTPYQGVNFYGLQLYISHRLSFFFSLS